jgi:peptidyl-prolyl cis-trans isomerase B (cyclophilin B)
MTDNQNATATLHTEVGDITLTFFVDKAPAHVENFLSLAGKGFYDGTVFHRVIPNFMVQGGCPDGTGMGGPGHNVDAEFNDTKHVRGTLSMARSSDPNSAGSQFFLCHGEASFLDGQYTAFGEMTEGGDVLDAIVNAPTRPGGEGSSPVEPVKINNVTVTRG